MRGAGQPPRRRQAQCLKREHYTAFQRLLHHETENTVKQIVAYTIVIFAGYTLPMQVFLTRNPGMRSRISFRVEFEDYSTEELCEITALMAAEKGMRLTAAAMEKLRRICDSARKEPDFGNGRFVRKVLEEA